MPEPEPMPTYTPEPEDEAEPSPAPTTVEEEEDEEEEEYEEEEEEYGEEEEGEEEYEEPTPSPIDDSVDEPEPEPATPMDEPYTPTEATFAPSAPPPIAPTTAECEDPVGAYNQCGGTDYEGSTCCRMGYECEEVTDCYAEVRLAGLESRWPGGRCIFSTCLLCYSRQHAARARVACRLLTRVFWRGVSRDPLLTSPLPCPTPLSPFRTSSCLQCRPREDKCSEGWAQCGGVEWEGPTCCWDGAVCLERNEWYSQCVPDE